MKPLCFWKSRRLCVHSANAAVHSTRSLQSEPRLLRRLVIAVWWHTQCMHGACRTKVSEKSHPGPMHAETHWADHGLGFALTFWMLSGQNLSPVAGFLWFPTYGWPHLVSHPQSENRESIKHNSFIWLYCLKFFKLLVFVCVSVGVCVCEYRIPLEARGIGALGARIKDDHEGPRV